MKMATKAAIVKRRTTDSIWQLASDNSSMQLEPGQWGFAAADQTLVIRDLEGGLYHIKTESAILDSILVKEPVQTAAVLPSGDRVGTLRMVLDGNSYWFKTESNWVQMPDIEWIREEIGYIEENARQIDTSDNGNGSFTFTNYYGEEKVIPTGKRVQSVDSTVAVTESDAEFDLSIQPALDDVQRQIDTVNAAIDTEAVTDVQVSATNTAVTQTVSYKNLLTGGTRTESANLPTASEELAGNMDSEMFIAFEQYGIDIAEIKAMLVGLPRQVVAAGLGASPTQQQITAAFNGVFDVPAIPGDKAISLDDSDVWIMGNAGQWLIITSAEVELASTANPGLAQHSTQLGSIGYYVAGVGQVNGWDALNTAVTNAQAAISSLQTSVASKADNQQSLAATTNNTDSNTDTGAYSSTLPNVLQTIWNKIRSVANNFANYFPVNLSAATDFNNYTNPGIYNITGTSANKPPWGGETRWTLVVLAHTSKVALIQIAVYYHGGAIYYRTLGDSSNWGSWVNFLELPYMPLPGGSPSQVIQGDGTLRMKIPSQNGESALLPDMFRSDKTTATDKHVAVIGSDFLANGWVTWANAQKQFISGVLAGDFHSGNNNSQFREGGLNSFIDASFVGWVNATANLPPGVANGWFSLVNIRHRAGSGNGNQYGDQLLIGTEYSGTAGRMWTRSQSPNGWSGWTEFARAGDLSGLLPLDGSRYMTGAVNWGNINALRTLLQAQMGDSDVARIATGANGSNQGWLEIATADDGNEPIYVRQYEGWFGTVRRTLTLLDANGFTQFPSYINLWGNDPGKQSETPQANSHLLFKNQADGYVRSFQPGAKKVIATDSSGAIASLSLAANQVLGTDANGNFIGLNYYNA